jgi:hypothetical protein
MPFNRRSVSFAFFLSAPVAISCATAGTSTPLDGGGSNSNSSSSGASSSGNVGSSSSSSSSGTSSSSSGGSGSSGGSSGSSDAAGSGSGGIDGGGSDGGCGNRAAAIHDDFESGSLGSWQVTDPFGNPIPQGSTQYQVTIDTVRAHSGTRSVKVHGGGLIGVTPPAPAFYGRVWTWLGSSPGDVPSGGHWGWIIGVGPGDSGQPVEVRMGGQFGILIHNYSPNDDVVLSDPNFFNDGMDGGTRAIAGAWTCVEFYFGQDSLRTWINGAEVTSLEVTPSTVWAHGMRAPWSPAYRSIRIGYANYNANAIDVWYDDAALDTSRICCQ